MNTTLQAQGGRLIAAPSKSWKDFCGSGAERKEESLGRFGKEGSIIRVHKARHSRTLPVIPGVAGSI